MPSKKITDYTALTAPANNDVLPIVDVSEAVASDRTKKITIPNLTSQLSAASTSAAGIVQLSSATNSTSATLAATASAVKSAYDLANAAIPSSGNYAAKAWVNFNGTGTVAIRASANVTSITDHGTGAYTVNFTTALADANYAIVAVGGDSATNYNVVQISSTTAPTTTTVRLTCLTQNSGNPTVADHDRVCVAIFR